MHVPFITKDPRHLTLWALVAALIGSLAVGCADDAQPTERDLTLRVFNASGADGFPESLAESIFSVRIRVYQHSRELSSLTRVFDFDERGVRMPTLDFGERYQLVVEALGLEDEILADGATPIFDFLPDSPTREIHVFVSALGSIEYASALFRTSGGIVAAPSEFEGPEVAASLGLGSEALGGQRAGHTATLLPDGRLLVVGGARLTETGGIAGTPFASFIDTVEVYDPYNGYWTMLRDLDEDPVVDAEGNEVAAPMQLSEPRAFHTATLMNDGRVLIAGGFFDGGGFVDTSGAVDIIDPSKGTIEALVPGSQDLLTPRALHTAHLLGNSVVIVGGVTRTFDRPNFTGSIEVFDPGRGLFDGTDDVDTGATLELAVARGLHASSSIPGEGIFVSGGRTANGVTATVEFIEERGDGQLSLLTGSDPPSTRVARFGHEALVMEPDFAVLNAIEAGESDAERAPVYLALAGGFTAVHPDGDEGLTLLSGASLTDSVEFFDTWDLEVRSELDAQLDTARAHFEMIETSITRDLVVFGGVTGTGVTDTVERLLRDGDGGFPLRVNAFDGGLNQPRAYSASALIQTHSPMVVGGWPGGSSATVCGQNTITAGCTSELANTGDLFGLGYLY